MALTGDRLRRERRTLTAMITMYCRSHHGAITPCLECAELREYALQRIDKCPFGADKRICAKCPVHCYGLVMRERVRKVMRYSGPRMLLQHPVLACLHYLDGVARSNSPYKRKK